MSHQSIEQDRTIYVTVKNVYGNDLVYPACDDSRAFAQLTNSKTFNANQLHTIRALGYNIVVKTPSIEF